MARSGIGLKGGLFAVLVGTLAVVGCSDDDDDTNPNEGGSGGSAGSAGSKAGSAGSSSGSGGKAGSGNEAGTGNEAGPGNVYPPLGGEGGGGTEPPVGGEGGGITGQGGEGGSGEETFAEITEVDADVFAQASDLRGLRFSATGNKLWATGHLGMNANPSVLGDPDKRVIVARFLPTGAPDTTFSGDGFLELDLTERDIDEAPEPDLIVNDGNEESLGVIELPGSGDIIVSANRRDANGKGMDAVLVRLTAAGEYVDSFGTDGVAEVTFGWPAADDATFPGAPTAFPSDTSWGIELDNTVPATPKIVVFAGGTAAKGQMTTGNAPVQRTDNDRYITRVLAATGAVDAGFNGGVAFSYNSGGILGDNARRGIVEADGSILSAGYVNLGDSLGNHIVAIRLLPTGLRDMTFGFGLATKGVLRSNPLINDGGVAECYNLVRQANGRIITTGYGAATATGVSSSFGFVSTKGPDLVSFAYTADGKAMDASWGIGGMFVPQSEEVPLIVRWEERGRDMALLADQRLVYAGNYGEEPAIYVTTPDGDFEPESGIGNLFTYDALPLNGTNTAHFFRVVVSPDGTRIAASSSQSTAGALVALLQVGE